MKRFIWTSIFTLLFTLLATQVTSAQEQAKRFEGFIALGGHSILNDMTPEPPGTTGYIGVQLLYNLTETQALSLRYGAASYEINSILGNETVWMGDVFATYRYSWRAGKPTRIYIEAGLGASDVVPLYDTGSKFAVTFALGLKRFLGERISLGVETRGIGFSQQEGLFSADEVTVSVNEFTVTLGMLF